MADEPRKQPKQTPPKQAPVEKRGGRKGAGPIFERREGDIPAQLFGGGDIGRPKPDPAPKPKSED